VRKKNVRKERRLLAKIFRYLLAQLREADSSPANTLMALQVMLEFLKQASFLSVNFAGLGTWNTLRPDGGAGYAAVQSQLRIGAPAGDLAVSDHVCLETAGSPANSATQRIYSMDALVESYEPGLVTFRCSHPLLFFAEKCSWELRNYDPL
jgi:hypothetical protein